MEQIVPILNIPVGWLLFLGIPLSCLAVATACIAWSVCEFSASGSVDRQFSVRNDYQGKAQLVLADNSLSKRIISLFSVLASLLYGPVFSYLFIFVQFPAILRLYGVNIPDLVIPTLISQILFTLIVIITIIAIYVCHISFVEGAVNRVIQPLLLPISFYREYGWRTITKIYFLRVLMIWFVGGSVYSLVIGSPLVLSGDIRRWYLHFGFSAGLPGNFLFLFYLRNRRAQTDNSESNISELRNEHRWLNKVLEEAERITLSLADSLGIVTRQGAAKIFSYYFCTISLLILVSFLDIVLDSSTFSIVILPSLFCIFILFYSGAKNFIRYIREVGQNYVVDSAEEATLRGSQFEKDRLTLGFNRSIKNIIIGNIYFLILVFLADKLPLVIILFLDGVISTIPKLAVQLMSFVTGVPRIALDSLLHAFSYFPHPGKWALILLFSILNYYILSAAVRYLRIFYEQIIYFVLEYFNPYKRGSTPKESISAFGKDLYIIYGMLIAIPVVQLIFVFVIYLIASLFSAIA